MQSALRPYVTAGVALVGASAIAVTPVTAPPAAIEQIRENAVELSALDNPIDVFRPIIEQAIANATELGQTVAANPAPILQQIIANQIGDLGSIGAGIKAQIGVIPEIPQLLRDAVENQIGGLQTLGGLGQELVESLITVAQNGVIQDLVQGAIAQAQGGDLGGAFNNLALGLLLGVGLGPLSILIEAVPVLQQPLADLQNLLPIGAGPLANAEAVIPALSNAGLLLGLTALAPVVATGTALGDTIDDLTAATQAGDPEAAFNAVLQGAGRVTSGLINSVIDPGFPGLLPTLQNIRQQIAQALGAPLPSFSTASVAELPVQAAKSFTLAPLKEIAVAPKASTPSVDEKAGATGTGAAAPVADKGASDDAAAKDSAKGGNLFTPGATSTKGGRHRADTGSFAQGLRDTIKGLTGLGREKKSDKETSGASASKSDESGSSSSGSGDSGSGGGSESK